MAKPRRKRRTSIRTAAGTVQDQFKQRIAALRDDPLRVLPDCPDGDPKPIAKMRGRVERMAAGKVSFLDRRDKSIVGAVANALPLADLEAIPRIADHKVAGKRRFYLQRGHVARNCSLGVQNHDDPIALLMAYRQVAKDHGLHFFTGPRLVCSGTTPKPPAEWLADLTECKLAAEAPDRFGCGHQDVDRVLLRFIDGPGIAVCGACSRKEGSVHARIAQRYAGPKQRQPVDVMRLGADGTVHDLESEKVAAYRGGLLSEADLLRMG